MTDTSNHKQYERTQTINLSADEVFSYLSNVNNLPHYLPPIKEARIEGPSTSGMPGERVWMLGEIPDRGEFESEGYLATDNGARRLEWGAEVSRDYSGWLTVVENNIGASEVTVHLSFGPRTVEGQIQEESSDERDPLDESLQRTLESIRSQLEEAASKEPQPPAGG